MSSNETQTRRRIVVDGSNIATEGRTLPSLAQLDEAIQAFLEEFRGFATSDVTVVVDASFGHRIDESERAAFEEAVLHGEMVTPPAGAIGRGDGFILRIAEKSGALVLSNDSFQEFHAERPWLFDDGRLIGGKPVPGVGWIFTPRTPVRGPRSRAVTSKSRRATRGEEATELAVVGSAVAGSAVADGVEPGRVEVPGEVSTVRATRATRAGKAAKATKAAGATKATKAATTQAAAGKATKATTKAAGATKATKAAAKATKAAGATKAVKATKSTGPTKAAATKAAAGKAAAGKAAATKAAATKAAAGKAAATKAAATKATKAAGGAAPTGTTGRRPGAPTPDAAPDADDGSLPALNDPLAFITFLAAHPIGSTVEGTVASFTSHGAHVDVGTMRCHVPLRGLGHPAPGKARDVLAKGETRAFVLVSVEARRRRAELALPGVG